MEAKKRCMLVVKVTIKQPKVIVLEASKEWDMQRERITKPRGGLVKIELDGLKKTTLVGLS